MSALFVCARTVGSRNCMEKHEVFNGGSFCFTCIAFCFDWLRNIDRMHSVVVICEKAFWLRWYYSCKP